MTFHSFPEFFVSLFFMRILLFYIGMYIILEKQVQRNVKKK
jgi:hypothetical protein